MGILSEASAVWTVLKGVVCVYKPPGVSVFDVRKTILGNITKELCELKCRPPINHVFIEDDPGKQLRVYTAPSFADDPLVVGPRYQPKDMRCAWATHLGKNISGVFIIGLNDGVVLARKIHQARPTRTYHVKGRLGEATDTYFINGKVVEKATYAHVKQSVIDHVLASMQASHQRLMFERSGVDLQSQAAYVLAAQGPIRPSDNKIPLLYGIKCIYFQPPDFTLEIQCINEYEKYIQTLVHDIGMQLHSVATCTGIRCVQYSHFKLEHALLRKHWHLQEVVTNLNECRKIMEQHSYITRQRSARLIKEDLEMLEAM